MYTYSSFKEYDYKTDDNITIVGKLRKEWIEHAEIICLTNSYA